MRQRITSAHDQSQAAAPASPRTVVASMAPVATPQAAQAAPVGDFVLRTSAESWLEVVAADGAASRKGCCRPAANAVLPPLR